MSFSSWSTDSSTASRQFQGFLCTMDDLSYAPSDEQRQRDAAQVDVTGRRTWKTLKGKGEAVWPPILLVQIFSVT